MGTGAARYRYEARDPITGALVDGNMRLIDPSWSRAVAESGEMSARIVPPDPNDVAAGGAPRLERLKRATTRRRAAWYVKSSRTGQYVWGGPVVGRSWDGKSLSVKAVEWRAWLYEVPLIPDPVTGRDILYRWAGQDQIAIARAIVQLVTGEPGSPAMDMIPYAASGKLRDLQVYGSELKSAGELIDSMATRDGGFDWSVEIVTDEDGIPHPRFATWYPARGVVTGIKLRSNAQERKANIIGYGPVDESLERFTRFWATGAGQAPDVLIAQDSDVDFASSSILRSEGKASYTSVTQRDTLASHARANRRFYESDAGTLQVTVPVGAPDAEAYDIGDRVQLRIVDRMIDYDYPAVRILSRKISAKAEAVDLVLDLSDVELPEVDEGA